MTGALKPIGRRRLAKAEIIQVRLAGDSILYVEATQLGGEEDVAFGVPDFSKVTEAIEGVARSLASTIERVKPQKAVVEFGIEVAVDSGALTAVLVKGSSKANIKVTLEWSAGQST
jgi:hypothetical protein